MLTENKDKIEELAELLLKKETLSLPDIVDTLGERPYAVKESVTEYLTELRARQDTVDEVRSEEEAKADAKRKAAIDATKFDPDAEEPAESEEKQEDAAAKADDDSDAAAADKPDNEDADEGKKDGKKDEENKDKDKKE